MAKPSFFQNELDKLWRVECLERFLSLINTNWMQHLPNEFVFDEENDVELHFDQNVENRPK